MKSGAEIYLKIREGREARAIAKLKNGSLRSLLTYLLRQPLPADGSRESLILGMALVEGAERFRRGTDKPKLTKRRIL